MKVSLTLRKKIDLPIEADSITPTNFANQDTKEIEELPVYQGNQVLNLADFFRIEGTPGNTPNETEIIVQGNLTRVKMIGKKMNGGKITIEGDAGWYLGAEMISGRIHVKGSVGPWTAAEMRGGNIQIEGDAEDYLCAGYRGSKEGMRGGRVYVAGNVGREMAAHMRRGFIAVKGSVGYHTATHMQGGSIIVIGDVGERIGIGATRGMIFVLGRIQSLLPTFRFSGSSEREFTNYYLRYLKDRRPDFIEEIPTKSKWIKYLGDFAEGRTELEVFALAKTNQHLRGYNSEL
ncbi:MAG: formylmethanofuran dehydrogenase subunit C [Candidatus Lokiarchaeota archaeon]|nr:formylmethanofuran dehydrogenase subunit C [Candidatus Lokiarchaeota archaeon]